MHGINEYQTCRDVEVAFRKKGFSSGMIDSVRGNLLKLEIAGYLEALIQKNGWKRSWRLKAKYVNRPVKA